jgi:hypothetical protein
MLHRAVGKQASKGDSFEARQTSQGNSIKDKRDSQNKVVSGEFSVRRKGALLFFQSGDYNKDGIVDAADYTLWRDTRGENVLSGSGADGNCDGMVNQADYVFWKNRFGNMLAGGSSQLVEVPEPAGQQWLWLVLTMAGAMARQGPLATGRRIRPHPCRG